MVTPAPLPAVETHSLALAIAPVMAVGVVPWGTPLVAPGPVVVLRTHDPVRVRQVVRRRVRVVRPRRVDVQRFLMDPESGKKSIVICKDKGIQNINIANRYIIQCP